MNAGAAVLQLGSPAAASCSSSVVGAKANLCASKKRHGIFAYGRNRFEPPLQQRNNRRRPSRDSRGRRSPWLDEDRVSKSDVAFEERPYFYHEQDEVLRFFATCPRGLEAVVAAELKASSIEAVEVRIGSSGVHFKGDWRTGFRASLWLRSAIRVLQLVAAYDLPRKRNSLDSLYQFIRDAADWKKFLALKRGRFRTFSVQTSLWDFGDLTNSAAASTRTKDAVCDAVRSACNGLCPEPPRSRGAADMPLFLSLYRGVAMLYRDMNGFSLHMRGYRDAMHKASLNEAIAAGALTMAGWNKWVPGFGSCNKSENVAGGGALLLDPMCGSGTFLIEAALMVINKAPGLMRKVWPFESWHDFDDQLWEECREEAIAAQVEAPRNVRLMGNDAHDGACRLCVRGMEQADVRHLVKLSCQKLPDYTPRRIPSMVICNPPWGKRLAEEEDEDGDDDHTESSLVETYIELGRFLKRTSNKADVYILSGNSNLTRELCMKADRKWPLSIGGLDCKLLHYYVLPPKPKVEAESSNAEEVAEAEPPSIAEETAEAEAPPIAEETAESESPSNAQIAEAEASPNPQVAEAEEVALAS